MTPSRIAGDKGAQVVVQQSILADQPATAQRWREALHGARVWELDAAVPGELGLRARGGHRYKAKNAASGNRNPGNTSPPSRTSSDLRIRAVPSDVYAVTLRVGGSITHTRRTPASR
jgi:hypothetical protein